MSAWGEGWIVGCGAEGGLSREIQCSILVSGCV